MLFWTGFGTPHSSQAYHACALTLYATGVLVRMWQLGIEMRPLFARNKLWVYPVYAATGASFGYWMLDVERRQMATLQDRKEVLLEKRRRRDEREAKAAAERSGQAVENGTTMPA